MKKGVTGSHYLLENNAQNVVERVKKKGNQQLQCSVIERQKFRKKLPISENIFDQIRNNERWDNEWLKALKMITVAYISGDQRSHHAHLLSQSMKFIH